MNVTDFLSSTSAATGCNISFHYASVCTRQCINSDSPGYYLSTVITYPLQQSPAVPPAEAAHSVSFFTLIARFAGSLRTQGRLRTAETYEAAARSFYCYRKGSDLAVQELCREIVEGYQAWLRDRGAAMNTVSFYMRVLRAAYHKAVNEELTPDRRPFCRVFTGNETTTKRALPLAEIRKIRLLDLSGKPALGFARDMFMLSFYLRGMSFVDMAYLRREALCDGFITYRRRKTGQPLRIAWTAEMQLLADKYQQRDSEYLLPIIKPGRNARAAYRNASYNINRHLKQIAAMLGLTRPLTMYVARHSWATAAKELGIPLSIISDGLGHNRESTTRIYLATLDQTPLDEANQKILHSLTHLTPTR